MAIIRSYTVIYFTDSMQPGHLFADISDSLQSEPKLFFEDQLGHIEEYSYHSCKHVHVYDYDYVKAYQEGIPESSVAFASLDDACLYVNRESDLYSANWHYTLFKNGAEVNISPKYFDALHGKKLRDALEQADGSISASDKVVAAGWVTTTGIPLLSLSYNELLRYKLEKSSNEQESSHESEHIDLPTTKNYKSELTYLSKNEYKYYTVEIITDTNTQEAWQAQAIDIHELLSLFGVNLSDIDGEETIKITSRVTHGDTEQECYKLENLIEDRDKEHGTSEIEMDFILEHNVSEYDDEELYLNNRERIHQHCEDNGNWESWLNCLCKYYDDIVDKRY